MTTPKQHWNSIFSTKEDPELGWYEKDASQMLTFLGLIPRKEIDTVFLPGAGTSVLVDELLAKGHEIILNDISDEALHQLKNRIGSNADKLVWLHHDISKPLPNRVPKVDIWIDRAVLHFLLDEKDITQYFFNLHSTIRSGGYVLLAEFSTTAPSKCAGLKLHRYTIEEMTNRMGSEFTLIKHEEYTYINPFGDPRPYIYALYKKDIC